MPSLPPTPLADIDTLPDGAAILSDDEIDASAEENELPLRRNFDEEPTAFLQRFPLEKTRKIHLAGHSLRDGMRVDDHGSVVCDEVTALFVAALRRTGKVPVLFEWDTAVPALDTVLDEADRLRALMNQASQ